MSATRARWQGPGAVVAQIGLVGLVVCAIVMVRCAGDLPPPATAASDPVTGGAPIAGGATGRAPGQANADPNERTAIPMTDFVADEARPLDDLPPGLQYVQVVHASDGRPVAGATVWFMRPGSVPPDLCDTRQAADQNTLQFQFLQARGTATTTDSTGRAVVRSERTRLAVAACADDAAGILISDHPGSPPAGGWVLTIRPCARLRIEVRDHAGAPVPHAPLAFAHDRGGERIGMTDEHGVRDLVLAEEVLAAAREGQIWVPWPGGEVIAHRFDAAASTVHIVLPAGGQLEVHCVDRMGRSIPGHHSIEFAGNGAPVVRDWSTDADGVLRLPWVPLGIPFALRCWQEWEHFDGPVAIGQTTRCLLRAPADHAVCRGRLLGENGEPIARTPFLGHLEPTQPSRESSGNRPRKRLWPVAEVAAESPWSGPLPAPPVIGSHRVAGATDAEGRFAFVIGPPVDVGGRGVIWLAAGLRNMDCRHVEFAFVPQDGTRAIELGDLVVGEDGLVLTGRVVTPRGLPVPDASFDVGWAADLGRAVAVSGENGEFRVYRSPELPEEPVWLSVAALGAQVTHQGRVGDRDVDVLLRKRPIVRFEVLVDAAVVPLANQAAYGHETDPGSAIGSAVARGDRWVFSIQPAPEPQAVAAYVQLGMATFHTATLASRDGHEVVHRADMRGRFHVLRLDVRNDDGEALAAEIREAARGEDGAVYQRTVLRGEEGDVQLVSMSPTAVLEVARYGHESVTVTASAVTTRVVLRRLPTFTVELRGDRGDLRLRLQERLPDGKVRELDGSHLAASFAPIRVEAVLLDAEGQQVFSLPLQPIPLGPEPEQQLAVELAPDQLRQLQAAWSAR